MKIIPAFILIIGLFASGAIAEEKVFSLAKHLELAGQPEGEKLAKIKGESYRFISHDPGLTSSTIVLVTKDDSKITLSACRVSLNDYYGSKGKSGVERIEKLLPVDQWLEVQEKLSRLDYWHYKAEKKVGVDGAYWVLEGAKDGVFRQLDEWSPDPGDFRESCLYMWRISGLFMGNYRGIQR